MSLIRPLSGYDGEYQIPIPTPKPPIEKWSPEYRHELTKKLVKEGIITSCFNCANFNHHYELCTLVQQRPPARTIAQGCPAWEEDIPF